MLAIFAIVIVQIFSAEAFLEKYPELVLGPRDDGDPGDPLFLTPYVEAGNITEARQLARVPFTETLNITSYSGYFTVNKTYDSNQFFWYFPAMNSNESAPVVVWLQGGPGASSLYGLFVENGPIQFLNGSIERRNTTWASNHHMIYIDNPVGTGFSFTKNDTGYCTDEVQVGEELYATMSQFYQLFPELQPNKLFISGESYAGKYAPAFAYTIHKKNPTAQVKINLQGIAVGNGLSDPIHQLSYDEYLYQLGLIDWNQADVLKLNQTLAIQYMQEENWIESYYYFQCVMNQASDYIGLYSLYNYIHDNNEDLSDFVLGFRNKVQDTSFRSAIHVGELPYDGLVSMKVYSYMRLDVAQSVAPWVTELLDHYNVLIYNGQLDIIVAYPLTVNYLRNLKFSAAEEYETADRHIWVVDQEVAGYVKQAGNLTEIMVRNAGHKVPYDQPKWALDMITRFTHEEPYY